MDLGARLAKLRDTHKQFPGYERMAREIENDSGIAMSKEQVRRYHIGEVDPEDAAVEELVALRRYYRVPGRRLGLVAARRIELAASLFIGPDTGGEQHMSTSRCTERHSLAEVVTLESRQRQSVLTPAA